MKYMSATSLLSSMTKNRGEYFFFFFLIFQQKMHHCTLGSSLWKINQKIRTVAQFNLFVKHSTVRALNRRYLEWKLISNICELFSNYSITNPKLKISRYSFLFIFLSSFLSHFSATFLSIAHQGLPRMFHESRELIEDTQGQQRV